nr:Holliday junction branch migration protein RuvA [Agromyces seonyuensis]
MRGTVLATTGGVVVIEAGGVGFSVNTTPALALSTRVGEEARVHTSLIVRDDGFTLYGFAEQAELEVFQLLIGVTGVGPKSALGVLAALSPEQVAQAVADEQDAAFRKVSGIGPKTAKLITLQLAGKLAVVPSSAATGSPVAAVAVDDVVVALIGLGWPERTARQAVEELVADDESARTASVSMLLRLALGRLGSAQSSASPLGGRAS